MCLMNADRAACEVETNKCERLQISSLIVGAKQVFFAYLFSSKKKTKQAKC